MVADGELSTSKMAASRNDGIKQINWPRTGRREPLWTLLACLLVAAGAIWPAAAGARAILLDETASDIRFLALAPEKPPAPGVGVLAPDMAKKKVMSAYSLLRAQSPASARQIDRLLAAGDVFIVYDPDFPGKEFSKLTVAAFIPDYIETSAHARVFPVVVGRFGIHWPAQDLAGVLAHELVGHGVQHLEGRLTKTRTLELECEAWLYQERAHQDLGIDKFRQDLIDFRRQLETIWCADLRTYQRKTEPGTSALWDRLDPDVPGLLASLKRFEGHLRDTGVLSGVLAATKQEKRMKLESRAAEALKTGDPDAQFAIARAYKNGAIAAPDPREAVLWLRRAAEKGHAAAQFELGMAHLYGDGVAADEAEAYRWFARAAALGYPAALKMTARASAPHHGRQQQTENRNEQ